MAMNFQLQTANTILYCRRWRETVDFYQHQLNFPVTFESDWFVEFQVAGAAHLSIADERRATIKSGDGAGITLTFQVTDIDGVWHSLNECGVAVGPVQDHAWGARLFHFTDPEGHRLEIWSSTAEEGKR